MLLASFRDGNCSCHFAGRLAFRPTLHKGHPPYFFRERCTMFMFIAAAVILAAVTGGVVAAIRRSHNQACIDKRLRMYCSG